MTPIAHLQSFVGDTISMPENIRDNGPVNQSSLDFDYQHLNIDIHITNEILEQYKLQLNELTTITGPVLYWFEVVSSNTAQEILTAFMPYKISKLSQNVSPNLRIAGL